MGQKKIQDILLSNPNGETLYENLEQIKKCAAPILNEIILTFPDYTSHDITHSERIIDQFNNLFPDSLKEALNEYEIFFFLASIYLHDIGMVKTKNDNFIDIENIQEVIRASHHIRSEKYILEYYFDLSIEDDHQAAIIGRICSGHRKEDLYNIEKYPSNWIYKKYPINLPLLSSLLKLCDEFDFTFSRTPSVLFKNKSFMDEISKEEWRTHLSISGVTTNPDDARIIQASAKCRSPQIHRKLRNIEDKINNQLDELPNHLHHYRGIKTKLPIRFDLAIDSQGYEACDFKFSLQEREIIKLLMGEKLYQNKTESIRELLKNSIDACHLRREILKKEKLNLESNITIKHLSNSNQLVIIDNGIGMDKEIIEDYFTKIGKSFYRSKDFFDQDLKFTPVSELGIGVLSSFMIAERVIIESKKEGSDPIKIEIDDISDYFLITPSGKKEIGTIISLFLKEDSKNIDFLKEIQTYANHIDIDIHFVSDFGKNEIIVDQGYRNRFVRFMEDHSNEYFVKELYFNNEFFEGSIGFIFKMNVYNQIQAISNYELNRNLSQSIKDNEDLRKLSYEGIFINNKKIFPRWFDSEFYDINFKNDIIDLNVSRNSIVQNEKYSIFDLYFGDFLVKSLESFLNDIKAQSNISESSFSIFFKDFIDRNLRLYGRYHYEEYNEAYKIEALIDFVKRYYMFSVVTKSNHFFLNYNELRDNNNPILIADGISSKEHLQEILKNCKNVSEDDFFLFEDKYGLFEFIMLDEEYPEVDIIKLVGIKRRKGLKGILPVTWKLCSYENYESTKILEFEFYNGTFININNPFIDLLFKNAELLEGDKKIAVEGFFRTLKMDRKKDLNITRNKQKEILKWFVDENIISETDIERYLLTKIDFSPR